jgi:methyl-accepting chemotaxis protein
LGRTSSRLHLGFVGLPQTTQDAVHRMVETTLDSDRRFITATQDAAQKLGDMLKRAVEMQQISEIALFADDYREIAGSDPQQYLAAFTALTDQMFPAVQEKLMSLDPRVVFAVAMDRHGYLPTHNAIFSQPQRKGDPVWNAANARNRRIFNDRAGLAAVRSTRPFLLQTYERDMGGGKRVLMKEADAPIMVGTRHWGGFRLAYRADRA